MKTILIGQMFGGRRPAVPLSAAVDLTYRCNLDCAHCFCKGSAAGELGAGQWMRRIGWLAKAGCLRLTLSGGEPLLRDDFSAIYRYCHERGFQVTVFTNATLVTPGHLRLFRQKPPALVEVSLYGLTPRTSAAVTGSPSAVKRAMSAIRALSRQGTRVVVKTVGLRQNRDDILGIKRFCDRLLGKGRFRFDSLILPRLNGDGSTAACRLEPEEVMAIELSDADMSAQRRLEASAARLPRPAGYLYQCPAPASEVFLDPTGRMRFCRLSDSHSCVPGNARQLRENFARTVVAVRKSRFRSESPCRLCRLRAWCYFCPARSGLEGTGQEGPNRYYCRLAGFFYENRKKYG